MRFAIAAGGTGGHLFPGLAVAEVLHAAGHEVMLLTSEKHIDAVATEGRSEFRVERLPGIGLPRSLSLQAFTFLFRFASGVLHCNSLFTDFKPAAVLGMGGFTSTAPILAGRMRGLPVFVHESNAIPGKANRLNAFIAGGLLVGLEDCAAALPQTACTLTGTPIRRGLLTMLSASAARAKFGLDPNSRTLLVMGGSQGARGVNQVMVNVAPKLTGENLQIIHITGPTDEATVREAYRSASIPCWVAPFHHAMQDAYSAATIAIARSGAASLTELAYFKVPSILIPYPWAAEDHQTINAKVFDRAGAGLLRPESTLSPEQLAADIRLLTGDTMYSSMQEACVRLTHKDAAEQVANVLIKAAKAGGQK